MFSLFEDAARTSFTEPVTQRARRSSRAARRAGAYAALCFKAFGGRVADWITLNEPWCSAALGYANGEHAPGRREAAATEPYLAGHHMLLAHASSVREFRAGGHAGQVTRDAM